MNSEKVSVITVCYNSENTIRNTIGSVLMQDYRPLEFVVIDGNSSDGTVDIVREYEETFKLDNIELVLLSECDCGIYNAMNKGVRLSTGKWINFMNSDDSFYSENAISEIMKYNDDSVDIIYGDECVLKYDGQIEINKRNGNIDDIVKTLPFCHQSSFTKRKWLVEHPFDESLKIVADYEFFLFCYFKGAKFEHKSIIVANYYRDGTSRLQYKKAIDESYEVKGLYNLDNIYSIKTMMKKELRKIITGIRIWSER